MTEVRAEVTAGVPLAADDTDADETEGSHDNGTRHVRTPRRMLLKGKHISLDVTTGYFKGMGNILY